MFVEAIKNSDESRQQLLDVIRLDYILKVAFNLRADVKFSIEQLVI